MGTTSGPAKSEITVQNTSYRMPVFEPLESRLLLSADLIGVEPLAPLDAGIDQQIAAADSSTEMTPEAVLARRPSLPVERSNSHPSSL